MKNFILCCLITFTLVGCAGRTPNPVQIYRPGDESMSCDSIKNELHEINGKINELLPKSDRTGQNVALGAAGCFVFPAWFFMNFSDAEKVEIEAFRSRYNHLMRIYNDKKCCADKLNK